MRDAVKNPDAKSLNDFEDKISAYEGKDDYVGLLEYLLTLKQDLVTLPTTHKSSQLTIQRMILLLLPLFQKVEEDKTKHAALRKHIEGFCDIIE